MLIEWAGWEIVNRIEESQRKRREKEKRKRMEEREGERIGRVARRTKKKSEGEANIKVIEYGERRKRKKERNMQISEL